MSSDNFTEKWLIGKITPELTTSKLPTNRGVLKALLYNISISKNVLQSRNIVCKQLEVIWNNIGLKTVHITNIRKKLHKLHKEYEVFQRHNTRVDEKLNDFKQNLRKLFDIASGQIESNLSKKLKEFLKDQRSVRLMKVSCLKNEPKLTVTEKKSDIKILSEDDYNDESDKENINFDDEEYSVPSIDNVCDSHIEPSHLINPSHLANEIIRSPLVTSALDRLGMTDGDFNYLMGSIASVMKVDPSHTRLSRSTVKRNRSKNRVTKSKSIRQDFISKSKLKRFIVHWDGKLLNDWTNPKKGLVKQKVDRIATVVTSNGCTKLLGIPKVDHGTGHNIADAVYSELKKWDITNNVIGMCCDTTNSNTGWKIGACVELQQYLQKELLFFPCRHHIFEVILAAIFALLFGVSEGPKIKIFKRFKENWNKIEDKSTFRSLPHTLFNSPLTQRLRSETIEFLQNILADNSNYIPREDYRELIDLTLIILGVPNPSYKLKIPGALHHARWMCKIIYTFKMYLLSQQLDLSDKLQKSLEDFCLFCSLLYVKQWLKCPLLRDAAVNDLQFCKDIKLYETVNKKISLCAASKFNGHLSYLEPELAAFALFSDKVTDNEKRIMIELMKKPDGHWRRTVLVKNPHLKNVTDLITSRSLFTIYSINPTVFQLMLHTDPTMWTTCSDYIEIKQFVSKMNVVNDVAERSIAQITKFNSLFSYNEEEKQRILQIVEDHCNRFPKNSKKKDLFTKT